MNDAVLEKSVASFQASVSAPARLGVSDFARSKEWRTQLPELGCIEVVERGQTIGYLLSPETAQALNSTIDAFAERAEAEQIAAIFETRRQRTDILSGEELQEATRKLVASGAIEARMEALGARER